MTDKNFDENDEVQPEGAGSDAAASGPEPQVNQDSAEASAAEGSDDDFTVDDILNAEQTPEALQLDMPLEVVFEKQTDDITLPLFRPAKG